MLRASRPAGMVCLLAALLCSGLVSGCSSPAVTVAVSRAPSALAAVTAAARQTGALSHQMTITGVVGAEPSWFGGKQPSTDSGEFSPSDFLGEEDGGKVRIIGGFVYTYIGDNALAKQFHHGKSWLMQPAASFDTYAGLAVWYNPVGLMLTAPEDLLGVLHSAKQVRETGTASGPGWTGIGYAFSAINPNIPNFTTSDFTASITGTVDVDTQGRVRRLDMTITERTPGGTVNGVKITHPIYILTDQITIGDFGLHVSVNPPPASDVSA